MHQSVYYDSCIFLNAHNKTHREYGSCLSITSPANIGWSVWICLELIAGESTAAELVSAFEIDCALNGIIVANTSLRETVGFSKRYKNEKIQLRKLQLKDRDFQHLACAVVAKATALATVDPDFWDATNKRNPGAKRTAIATKKFIESSFPIKILSPGELLGS